MVSSQASLDMTLFLKLQKRVTEVEHEKQSLVKEMDLREEQFQQARARVWAFSVSCGRSLLLPFCPFCHFVPTCAWRGRETDKPRIASET